MPRKTEFSRDEIGLAAVELVRERGWDALTAKALAGTLKVSVAPIYVAFSSMDELSEYVLGEAVRKLDALGERQYSGGFFLNRGVGFVLFARDEPNLFLALYRTGRTGSIFDRYRRSVRERMKDDEWLTSLDDAALDQIFNWLWTFSLGMVLSILFGHEQDVSTEGIIERLRSAGSLVMYGVMSGIDRPENPEVKEKWKMLLKNYQKK